MLRVVPTGLLGVVAVLLALAAAAPSLAAPAAAPVDPAKVDEAIRRGVEFLYSKQANGNWEEVPARDAKNPAEADPKAGWQWGGWSSLATYALLATGENQQDKRIVEAVNWLKAADIGGVYAVGMRCQVCHLLTNKTDEIRDCIKKDAKLLLACSAPVKGLNRPAGLYHYWLKSSGWDHSTSQYGVLGTWACEQSMPEVIPSTYWGEVDKAWRGHQYPDGGWAYGYDANKPESTAAMTAAGVATLFITQDYLLTGAGDCRGNMSYAAIENGLKWMGKNFQAVNNNYAWYGVERIGVASGHKYFGDVDWYQEGVRKLLADQKEDGSFGGGWYAGYTPVTNTAFALLFLARGRAPVVMNKLDYSTATSTTAPAKGNWNERPRDAANLTKYLGRAMEKDLNWQIVNLKVSADDLHDAPILYIAGNEALSLSADDEAKVKSFVEQGGMILGNADCGTAAFADSFLKLGSRLFPRYEFRELPTDHPIYTRQQFPRINWKTPPSVKALSNGARELMVLVPSADPARAWNQQAFKTREELCQLGGDIIQYAVEKKNLRFKGETYIASPDPKIAASGKVKVARIEHTGNWDPEPGGWRRPAAPRARPRPGRASRTGFQPVSKP